ncbi:MAG: PAS domain S-box protein [Deltaproteobacteria bacterium]|nr:PAS domain S-box protein [Deltaproteobacteria bacterium]
MSRSKYGDGSSGPVGSGTGDRSLTDGDASLTSPDDVADWIRRFVDDFHGIAYRARMDFTPEFFKGAVEHITGYTEAELLAGTPRWDQVIHPDDLPGLFNDDEKRLHRPAAHSFERAYRIVRKDGEVRWLREVVGNIVRGDEVSGVQGALYDVTAQRTAEQSLRESEQRYQTVVEAAGQGILIADLASRRFRFANAAICRLLGYTRDELLTMSVADIHPPEAFDQVIAEFEALARGDKVLVPDLPCLRKDGTVVHVDITSTVATIHGEPCNLGFFTDATDRKLLHEERLKASKLESVGVLAGGIAHDFNNLLTAIQGNVELARVGLDPASQPAIALSHAEEACRRATDLTNQLITFARGGAPVLSTASMSDLLIESTTFALRGSGVRPVFDLAEDLRGAKVDEMQISRAIQNLVINARQAMADGGTLEVRAVNVAQAVEATTGPRVRITIRDEGVGIAEDHLGRIFDPYFTTRTEGRGLGLAIVYSIITRHGGHISATSKVGEFTEFTIDLPASCEQPRQSTDAQQTLRTGTGRVLVVDDQELVLDAVRSMLEALGYDVACATDGGEACRLYAEALASDHSFDLAILDLTMPGSYGGVRIVRDIKAMDPAARCIVSSGFASDPILADHASYGFDGVLAKPYLLQALGDEVAKVLSRDED